MLALVLEGARCSGILILGCFPDVMLSLSLTILSNSIMRCSSSSVKDAEGRTASSTSVDMAVDRVQRVD